ncbi:hypothetical protein DFH06DRAFT_1402691 [Mycena polygramma]|nr:hypothetical protein DFH06DRAFT_1402691 [Mycena polygramma]
MAPFFKDPGLFDRYQNFQKNSHGTIAGCRRSVHHKMFVSPLATLFFATAACAALNTQAQINVVVSSSHSTADSIADVLLTAAVTNNGMQEIKVVKYGTILDAELRTRSFTVTRNGSPVPFTGERVKFALSALNDRAFTTIAAGHTLTVVHNVSALFDFASVGPGSFNFTPVTRFLAAPLAHDISADKKVDAITATSNTITVTITRDVAPRDLSSMYTDVQCADLTKREIIEHSINESTTMAVVGKRYINERGPSDNVYQYYWGANVPGHIISVLTAVESVRSFSTKLPLHCDKSATCDGGALAHTTFTGGSTIATLINYCDSFFALPHANKVCTDPPNNDDGDSIGGVSLHEFTHALSGTEDYAYGCAFVPDLPDNQKIGNAETYDCFTAQAYRTLQC